jgi:hypothetical protein
MAWSWCCRHGFQELLVTPCGQVAWRRSKPGGERGLVIPGAGPGLRGVVQQQRGYQRDPERAGGVHDQLGRRIARID